MKTHLLLSAIIAIAPAALSPGQSGEPAGEALSFTTPAGWKGERIALPPEFAPEMKLEGVELIHFAPGMFDPGSDSFFSYVFAISTAGDAALAEGAIHDELLAYYRGLARSVLGGKGKKADTDKFTLEMKKAPEASGAPAGAGKHAVTEYAGTLDWVEPFATAKPQKLYFEIHSWHDPEAGRSYLVAGTSPRPIGEGALWRQLREVRSTFTVGGGDEGAASEEP